MKSQKSDMLFVVPDIAEIEPVAHWLIKGIYQPGRILDCAD